MIAKKALFWDFDGVMANSTDFVFNYWQKGLKQKGYDFSLADYQQTFVGKFPFDYLQKNFPDAASQIYERYNAYEAEFYPQKVEPYDDFIASFHTIATDFQHFVVSANLASVINLWLKKYQIRAHFSAITGREQVGHKDQKITELIAQHQLKNKNCLFIGDTTSDMNHAQKAGIEKIAVSWGVHSRQLLATTQPEFICDSIPELFTLLTQHASQ